MSVNDIISYEMGQMSEKEEIEFFAKIIKSGIVWQLQGNYGVKAKKYIDDNIITKDGDIIFE